MPKKMLTLFYGGVVNLGRNMNIFAKQFAPFVDIKEMVSADLRLVDLECVIATAGKPHKIKNHYFFRAKPEQTNILSKVGVDIVLTANDHSCDYGTEALFEQREYLDLAGILYVGSGKNISEAFAPVYKKVNGITLAIFSVDTIMPLFAATADKPGTAYLPVNNPELWKETFTDKIREAREKADVVIVAPHWGRNLVKKPSEELKKIGHLLIDLGADAVLGCNSHLVHGVENYKNRPIIYDAGDLLFDLDERNGGCFLLEISADGVEKIKFIPLNVNQGQTLRAIDNAEKIIKEFTDACAEFNVKVTSLEADIVEIKFTPPHFESVKLIEKPNSEGNFDKVPDEAIISPKNFDGLKLVGCYVPPDCRIITERKPIQLETYWTIEKTIYKNYILSAKAVPVRECLMPPYSKELSEDIFPVNSWKIGKIYRVKIELEPPPIHQTANVSLQLEVEINAGEKCLGKFKDPDLIKMKIPTLNYFNTDFDDINYQSEHGKCWTAKQLAKITGGKWIVLPPKGWYVQTISRVNDNLRSHPTLFSTCTPQPKDYHEQIIRNARRLDGAIVTQEVEGLPPNFPLLKVKNAFFATMEIGFAARKRFQGKVIGVTGSAGKSTTCSMLKFVLSKDHNISATPGNANNYVEVPWVFANVKPNDAYAVLEISADALNSRRGSVTYDIPPNVAVVTSIAPAHVGVLGSSLENIAKIKSNIFCGMAAGSYVVLNRDMPCYEVFEQKAKFFKLNIITFGTHKEAFVKMPVIANDKEFSVMGKSYKLSCPVPTDQLYDALAVVGVSFAVGFPIEKTIEYLKTFTPVRGRGNILKSVRDGKNLTIINSSYNANPESMKYALQHLKNFEPNPKARVAILGDIAELGEGSIDYHKGLADAMLAAAPDRILLCGEYMKYPYEMIKDKINAVYFETLDDLLKNVDAHLRDGDTILIKSSHATGLHKVVELLNKSAAPPPQPIR